MIQVKAPDGSIVQFPDGMSETEMLAAMQKEYGGPAIAPAAPEAAPKSMLQNIGETVSDATQAVGQGLTAGFSDELFAGALTPLEMARAAYRGEDTGKGIGERISGAYERSLKFNRDIDEKARERSPIASTVGEITGGLVTGGQLAKGGVTLLNAAKPTYPSMIARGTGEGALYGTAYGLGTGEGLEDRLSKAATGAVTGALTGAALGTVGAKTAQKEVSKAIPATSELKAASEIAYDVADKANVVISPQSWGAKVQDIKLVAAKEGFHPNLDGHRDINVAIKSMEDIAGQPITFRSLEQQRRILKSVANGTEPDAARIANRMVDKLDDFAENIGAKDIRAGTVAEAEKASSALGDARTLWGRFRRSEAIEDLIERAKLSAGQYSQSGMENALRKEFRAFAKNKDKMRGFSPEEKTAIIKVASGGPVQNLTRLVGKMAPRGVVSGGFALGAGAMGGPLVGGAVMAAGEVGKRTATAMTSRNAQRAAELVRTGGKRPSPKQLTKEQQAKLAAMLAAITEQEQRLPFGLSTTP